MTPGTVVAVVTRLYIAAGRQPPEQVDLEVWSEAMVDVDDEVALAMAKQIVRTETRFVTPAQFRAECGAGDMDERLAAYGLTRAREPKAGWMNG